MTRLNLFLLSILIVCAMGVITSQHKARKLYIELQKQDAQTRKLNVEWGQLQLEQSTWAMHSRIESEAANRLSMQVAPANRTQVILEHGQQVQKPQVSDLP
ncbi:MULTISPECIES: cell division protein FtsL [Chitinibacter]|uniref:cell division protein FtsL n=1 Tax=Chitinibacter TaxID=230666 RepID=UPI0004226FC6|nr:MULTISPECIES: cell division protein FtsL [Chitinibacter]